MPRAWHHRSDSSSLLRWPGPTTKTQGGRGQQSFIFSILHRGVNRATIQVLGEVTRTFLYAHIYTMSLLDKASPVDLGALLVMVGWEGNSTHE